MFFSCFLAFSPVLIVLFSQAASTLIGRLRLSAQDLLCDAEPSLRDEMNRQTCFLWVSDFPLFTPSTDRAGGWDSTHHPFTAPVPADEPLVLAAPEKVRGQHYDLVLNGVEIGGGSIRIHDANLQRAIFESVLRLEPEQCSSFAHLVEALQYGCPPHGGIALGFDRVMALLCGTPTIRDVIAFPKSNYSQGEPMVQSPAAVKPERLAEYHISVVQNEQQK